MVSILEAGVKCHTVSGGLLYALPGEGLYRGKDFSLLAFVLGLFCSPGVLFEFVRGWKVNSLMFDLIGVLVKSS